MNWNPALPPTQAGRTIVVTGATAGIGYYAAEQLAAAGAEVVLASRSSAKLRTAQEAIRSTVPHARLRSVVLELGSFAAIDEAAAQLVELPRLDGVLLNGAPMVFSRRARTADGLAMILGTHAVANVRLIARIVPAMIASATGNDAFGRIVHTSTGFVSRFCYDLTDLAKAPWTGVGAYTKAKTATEVFAYELDRRLKAAGAPVASIVVRPGVGVDAKTPQRPGIRDDTTPYRRNPYTPWAQGKDQAAWPAVRALTDPDLRGGELIAPAGGLRGEPALLPPLDRTAHPSAAEAERVWRELEELAGVQLAFTPAH